MRRSTAVPPLTRLRGRDLSLRSRDLDARTDRAPNGAVHARPCLRRGRAGDRSLGQELLLRQPLPPDRRSVGPSLPSTTTAGTPTTWSTRAASARCDAVRADLRALGRSGSAAACGRAPRDPRWLALGDTLQRYPVPLAPLLDLLDGVAHDLAPVEMPDFDRFPATADSLRAESDSMLGPVLGAPAEGFRAPGVRLGSRDAAHQRSARRGRGSRRRADLSSRRTSFTDSASIGRRWSGAE